MILLRQITGVFIIFLGILGLVLPILQGWALIFLGLYLLAPRLALHLKRRMLAKFSRQEMVYFEDWKNSGAHAAITTKHCPVFLSKTDDLSIPEKQRQFREWLFKNKIALSHGMDPSGGFVYLRQTHGDRVAVVEAPPDVKAGDFQEIDSADAVITNVRGVHLLVMTADCLSIYMKAGDWIGLVHAGWRGTNEDIGVKTAKLLSKKAGVPYSEIQIILGPAICKKNYEVGSEFREYFPKTTFQKHGKWQFDLRGENKRRLRELGVPDKQIVDAGICPYEDTRDYYSFRREKEKAGRMVSVLSLTYS